MIKKIILLSGDPNSINSELIFKSWKKINNDLKKKIYLISNYNLINKQFRKLNYKIKTIKVKSIDKDEFGMPIINGKPACNFRMVPNPR